MNWLTIALAVVLCLTAQSFDTWTTVQNLGGAGGNEYNPIVRWSLHTFGAVWAVKVLLLVPAAVLFVFSVEGGVVAMLIFALAGLAASWLNVRRWQP